MINRVNICSDGYIDCYDLDNCKVRELSGDITLIHQILKNVDTCINYSPSSIEPNLRFTRNPKFYFVISNTEINIEIPYKHVIRLSEFINNTNAISNSVN